jgi:hypothetical protein
LPVIARWSRSATVRYVASTHGTSSSHRYEWYCPVPGESRYCEPPYLVHASTNTTIAGGTSPAANIASSNSG